MKPRDYPAGYFLALVRKHNWPPDFRSDFVPAKQMPKPDPERNGGWGTGTIKLPNTPKRARPGWQKKA